MTLLTKNTGGRLLRIGNEKGAGRAAELVVRDLEGLTEVDYDAAGHASAGTHKVEIKSHKKGLELLTPEKVLQAP